MEESSLNNEDSSNVNKQDKFNQTFVQELEAALIKAFLSLNKRLIK
jgi:hypothetical protein